MKNIYLVQRANITLKPGTVLRGPNESRLSQAVNFDYMGSAEFEFGALPKSFRALQALASGQHVFTGNWRVFPVNQITEQGQPLYVFCGMSEQEFNEEYLPQLIKLRNSGYKGSPHMHTKEFTDFNLTDSSVKRSRRADFWWDIENHVMFSFNEKFMVGAKNEFPGIMHHVASSINYMEAAK